MANNTVFENGPHKEPKTIYEPLNTTRSNDIAGTVDLVSETHQDIGWDLYQQSLLMDPNERDVIAKRVKIKLDCILLPMMCTIYFLSYLDKLTLNYANAYGLQKDLNLVGRDYSWVASVTNIGYLVGSYPSNVAMQKLPVGKFVACQLILWGFILMMTTQAKNFAGLMALRFILGAAESCIGPAWMLLTSVFYNRQEQPLRMACWLGSNGVAQIVGPLLSWGFGHVTSSALTSWQLIFLVVGAISATCGIISLFILPSSPLDCIFFTPEEKIAAVWRTSTNKVGVKNPHILWYQALEAILDPKIYFIAGLALVTGIAGSAVTNFFSAILAGFGFDSYRVLLYQLPIGAFQVVFQVGAGFFNSTFKNFICISIILGFIPAIAGMVGIATISLEHQTALAFCIWIQGIEGISIIFTWLLCASNIAGHTKRTTANAVLFMFYSSGNIIGPFLFTPSESPRYLSAIKALAGVFSAGIVFASCFLALAWLDNRKRDRLYPIVEQADGLDQGFEDKTDRENKTFRYKL